MAVPALGVVKHLDVIEDILPGVLPRGVNLSLDALALEQLEEALGHRVVVAIAPPAHAALEVMGLQEVLPVMAAELATLV